MIQTSLLSQAGGGIKLAVFLTVCQQMSFQMREEADTCAGRP